MGIFNFLKKLKTNNDNENQDIEIKHDYTDNINEINEDFKDDHEGINIINNNKEQMVKEVDTLEDICNNDNDVKKLENSSIQENVLDAQDNEQTDNNIDDLQEKNGFFKKIFSGLDKTRKNIMGSVETVLKSFTKIDDELFEELEEILIMADIGVETTTLIIDLVKDRVKKEKVTEVNDIKNLIKDEITRILIEGEEEFTLKSPSVILVIGVNGVGKTTTIGKLTNTFKNQGKKVVLAAADTFRAAAIDQLEVWGNRSGVDVIRHQENSDPGAVVFDAINASKSRKADILICDTAGRLHNKKNLMDELKKIFKIINREYNNAQVEVFLVLDATTGQNALQQAKLFKEVANITGLVLTKLDGTAKGGIILSIKNELNIPVRFIGVGEGINDLQEFNAEVFAKALFGEEEN